MLRAITVLFSVGLCAGLATAAGPVRASTTAWTGGDRDPGGVYLLLKLRERRLYLVDGDDDRGATSLSFPVAVGRKEYATPVGRFRVTEKVVDPQYLRFDYENPDRVLGTVGPGPDNPLGMRWIGFTSAYGWRIGFHGTPKPELLGQAVSHGCVRMRNTDVVEVFDRVEVGTPVIVRP